MRTKFRRFRVINNAGAIVRKESKEQELLFKYFQHNPKYFYIYDHLTGSANGGSRHALEARNLKRQGIKAGFPDISLFIATEKYHGLFIELKRPVNPAPVSKEQKKWLERLNNGGYLAFVKYGWVECVNAIFEYLNIEERV